MKKIVFELLLKILGYNFVVENNKVFHMNEIFSNSFQELLIQDSSFQEASIHGDIRGLEWLKSLGFKLKYSKYTISLSCSKSKFSNLLLMAIVGYDIEEEKKILSTKNALTLNFFIKNINIKKVIKWAYSSKFIKSKKFKTKNNYVKGYNKN